MKKLIVLILISNALFAQEKTKVDKPKFVSIYWKPLLLSQDDNWAYGNKVGLGIEKRLSKKFDLTLIMDISPIQEVMSSLVMKRRVL